MNSFFKPANIVLAQQHLSSIDETWIDDTSGSYYFDSLEWKNVESESDKYEIINILNYYQLLLIHKRFTNSMLSGFYSLKEEWLVKFKNQLNWWAISINETIDWRKINIQLIEHHLSHCAVGEEDKRDNYCVECSENSTFPWTIPLIERWERKVNWCFLAQNKSFVTQHGFLIEHYENFFKPYLDLIAKTTAARTPNYFESKVHYQRNRFSTDIKVILEGEYSNMALSANQELLWHDIYQHILNKSTVEHLLYRIFQ